MGLTEISAEAELLGLAGTDTARSMRPSLPLSCTTAPPAVDTVFAKTVVPGRQASDPTNAPTARIQVASNTYNSTFASARTERLLVPGSGFSGFRSTSVAPNACGSRSLQIRSHLRIQRRPPLFIMMPIKQKNPPRRATAIAKESAGPVALAKASRNRLALNPSNAPCAATTSPARVQ
jgi:hypothetical protein